MKRILSALVILLMLTTFLAPVKADAASKVTGKIANGELTISGKGKMPAGMTYENNKKIKKVTIKAGVTSINPYCFKNCPNLTTVSVASSVKEIGRDAFAKCKKLSKLTLPGDYKVISPDGSEFNKRIMTASADYSNVDVTFNSALNPEICASISSKNLFVNSKDPNFVSVDGVVYSKNKKILYKLPSSRKAYTLISSCKTLPLSAVLYSWDNSQDIKNCCSSLATITFNKGLKSIVKYAPLDQNTLIQHHTVKPVVGKAVLGGESVENAIFGFRVNDSDIKKVFGTNVTSNKKMLYTKDGTLLRYIGKQKTVTIPDNITRIGDSAFYANAYAEQILMHENVTYIGDYAFRMAEALNEVKLPDSVEYLGTAAFTDTPIRSLVLPSGLKCIPNSLCVSCIELTSVEYPANVETIGRSAFLGCSSLCVDDIFDKMPAIREIGQNAFYGTVCHELTIPETVTVVDRGAFMFDSEDKVNVTIRGNGDGISPDAFMNDNIQVTYAGGISAAKFYFGIYSSGLDGNKVVLECSWGNVNGADGFEIQYGKDPSYKVCESLICDGSENEAALVLDGETELLESGYYARIRAFSIEDGVKTYSGWIETEY